MDALLRTYEHTDLFDQAVAAVAARHAAHRRDHEAERDAVSAELAKTEAAIDRYLRAFETGNLPEAVCGPRVRDLADTAGQLRDRAAQLAQMVNQALQAPTQAELDALRGRIKEAITAGEPPAQKALIQALVHEVRVAGRDHIQPVFRLSDKTLDRRGSCNVLIGAPGRIRTCAPGSGGRCSIP